MKIDLSLTIAGIIAVSSLVSPIATAIINNIHQRKMRKIEILQEHYHESVLYRRSVYEEFVRLANSFMYYGDSESMPGYYKAYTAMLVYAPEDLHDQIKKVNSLIMARDKAAASTELDQLCIHLSCRIQRMSPPILSAKNKRCTTRRLCHRNNT